MKWAARLAPGAIASLDPLRHSAEIELCEHDGELWLRGSGEMPRAVPWACRYELHDDATIREPGHHLPAGKLPAGAWHPLAEALRIAPPAHTREGFQPPPVTLSLAPCAEWQEPAMIELSAEAWLAFAETAPAIRLATLRFARTEAGRVFVAGKLLPSLPGARYVVCDGIATPAGFTWAPPVAAATLRAALQLGGDETIVFFHDRSCLRIPARAWQPAGRAAIRAHVA